MYACDRSRTINSRLVVGATKGCQEAGEPCPCKTGREFSHVRATCCTRTRSRPRLSSARSLAEARASRHYHDASWAGSQGGQGQEFLGVRECLAHIACASLAARKPGKRFSRGRSLRLARTLPLVEENIPVKQSICAVSL